MKKQRIKERVFAILLVVCMVFTMLPANAYLAVAKGDIGDVKTGVLDEKTNYDDNISWPIDIYDYHNDGMLFEFASATGDSYTHDERDKEGDNVYLPDMTTEYYADFTKEAIKDTYVIKESLPAGATAEPETDLENALKYYNFTSLPGNMVDLIDFRDTNSDGFSDSYGVSINEDGDYVLTNAFGYKFTIAGENTGADGTTVLVTDSEKFSSSNPDWAVNVLLKYKSENTYEVEKVVENPEQNYDADANGEITLQEIGFEMGSDDIIMIAHANDFKPGNANWQDKVAALALQEGNTVALSADKTTVTVGIPGDEEDPNQDAAVSTNDIKYAVLVYKATGLAAAANSVPKVEAFVRANNDKIYYGKDADVVNTDEWTYCVIDFEAYTSSTSTTPPSGEFESATVKSAGIHLHLSTTSGYEFMVSHFAMFDNASEAEVYGEKALVYNKHHIHEIYPHAEYSTDFTTGEVDGSKLETKWFEGAYDLTENSDATADNVYYEDEKDHGRKFYTFSGLKSNAVELIDFTDMGGIDKEKGQYAVVVFKPWGYNTVNKTNVIVKAFIRSKDKADGGYGDVQYTQSKKELVNTGGPWVYSVFDCSNISVGEEIYSAGIQMVSEIGGEEYYNQLAVDVSHFAMFATEEEAEEYGQKALEYNGYSGLPTAYYNEIYSNSGYGMSEVSQDSKINTGETNTTTQQAIYTMRYDKYNKRLGYSFKNIIDYDISGNQVNQEYHVGALDGIYFLESGTGSNPENASGSNYGFEYDGKDMSTLTLGSEENPYTLHQLLNGGLMTAGLLEPELSDKDTPVYRKEVVEYIAELLRTTLIIPEYDGGRFNYDFVRGEVDERYGVGEDGEYIDFATAIRNCLRIDLEGKTYEENFASYVTNGEKFGDWTTTHNKADKLIGTWKDCKNNIATFYDVAYFMLNNLFIEGSYNEVPEKNYEYIVFNKVYTEDGREGYIFDAGFTNGNKESAVKYNEDLTITLEGMDAKHVYYLAANEESYTTLHPFLPITEHNNTEHETKSPYFYDDGASQDAEYGETYHERDFNYVMKSDGKFVYRDEDNLFFEFEGDDDVYMFINGQLVLDIGGIHGITKVSINIDDYVEEAKKNKALAEAKNLTPSDRDIALALEEGQEYSFEFFYMERHGFGANCRIYTNMQITDPKMDVDKKAYQGETEIPYGGSVNGQQAVRYEFSLRNTGNTKLYDLAFVDSNIGVTIDDIKGLEINKDKKDYVLDVDGNPLTAEKLSALVTGYELYDEAKHVGKLRYEPNEDGDMERVEEGHYVETDPIEVTFKDNKALIEFMDRLYAPDTPLGQDPPTDENNPSAEGDSNRGGGLWAYSTVAIRGIYYQLTDEEIDQMYFENILNASAVGVKGDKEEHLIGQDRHKVSVHKKLVYYQWNNKSLNVDWNTELSNDLAEVIPHFNSNNVDSIAPVNKNDYVTIDGKNLSICYDKTGSKTFDLQVNYINVMNSLDGNSDGIKDGYYPDKGDDGKHTFTNIAGHVFTISDSNAIEEFQKIATNSTEYENYTTLYTISVHMKKTDDNKYEVVEIKEANGQKVSVDADWNAGDIVMIVHSSDSKPGPANWINKVAALALQKGDRVTTSESDGTTTVTVDSSTVVEVEVNVADVKDSVYVLDYGLSVDLSEDPNFFNTSTDGLEEGKTHSELIAINGEDQDPGKEGTQLPDYINNDIVFMPADIDADGNAEIIANDGTFNANIKNRKLTYTPSDFMDEMDSIYAAVSVSELGFSSDITEDVDINKEVRMFKKVSVLPANVVYYEDDFPAVKYTTKDSEGNVQLLTPGNEFKQLDGYQDDQEGDVHIGSDQLTQSTDQTQVYGQDGAYSNNSDMSGYSLTKIVINDYGAVANFEFTGTGFEMISRTNATDSAMLEVTVSKRTVDAEGNPKYETIKIIPVITEFDNGANEGFEEIYQVPVIRIDGLDHGTYEVSISGVPMMDFSNYDGTSEPPVIPTILYIDGFRVFQPLGAENPDYNLTESGAKFEEIRDLIVNGQAAVVTYSTEEEEGNLTVNTSTATWTENRNKETTAGTIFDGNKVSSANDYLAFGPNNEVYMQKEDNIDSALVFYVKEDEVGAGKNNLQIAYRAIDAALFEGKDATGTSATVQYGVYDDDDDQYKWLAGDETTIITSTEQYYTIPYKECPQIKINGEVWYQVAIKVVDGMISYTSLKYNGLTIKDIAGEEGEVPTLSYVNGVLTEIVSIDADDIVPGDPAEGDYPAFKELELQFIAKDTIGFEEIDKEDSGNENEGENDGEQSFIPIRYQTRYDKDIRLIAYVEELSAYTEVTFKLTIEGQDSKELVCNTAYSGLYANEKLVTTEEIFGEKGYFVTFTINNYLTSQYAGKTVTITATYKLADGTKDVKTRTVTIGESVEAAE